MTFETFARIVKEKRPDVVVYQHSKNNQVDVQFNYGKSKLYNYCGTYAQVLNRLNIPTVSKCDIFNIKCVLNRYKEQHGKPDWFGDVRDYSQEIKHYEAELEKYKNYIII